MGLICNIFGHKDEAQNFWGEQAQYILFKCNRCGKEHIHCSHEMRSIPNDETGKKVLHKMMIDQVFSDACRVHSEFVAVENDNLFSVKKKNIGYNRLREKYKLPENYRPACPVTMFIAGLWIDKKENLIDIPQNSDKKNESKKMLKKIDIEPIPNTDKEILKNLNAMDKEKFHYTNEVQIVEYQLDKKTSKANTIAELEKLEKIYAEKENYEKAGEIHKRIQELKKMSK
ncbi:MAG: hypothetical protein RLZ10_203 [Bacteroidota bacterium]|jgi:hypothetical protein